MARKNVFGPEFDSASDAAPDQAATFVDARPLANLDRPLRRSGPVGAFSQSLGTMSEKAQRADILEKKLAHGQAVVELDPTDIDSSFVPDRLVGDPGDLDGLVSQIREHGQQVPILVRPHPVVDGRYQVAYGHRRLAAIKTIGGPVRAVVRPLSDEQLVVSQGQENNARTDLSYIERTFFALRLERRGFSRDIIMSSLGVDKAALSRMITLAASLPDELIEAIGPAPGYGRTRWAELAGLLEIASSKTKALTLVNAEGFSALSSDARFAHIAEQLRTVPRKTSAKQWTADGVKVVKITETESAHTLSFNKAALPDFGVFVEQRLDGLYDEFLRQKKELKA
ncbi:MAG TPA: plasmid partitioning protein RepB [Pararhizobium sp.]|uniref:plasmid partitioning protein RepB n=1 Tax=Pararhizobium sp. TaxID=1977563 RepID=UPI002CA8E47B|nr:plasmid partitioning protein RepB [Pararhizobium sp.]HTO34348.1 plasmid partitioning protein RepB [Pararhizobium sp.]